tara:strand:- start:648 stop:998 length:351 start_codon:yes stop_codon:yes gene_type:complete
MLPSMLVAQDTVKVAQEDLNSFFLAIDTLREQDSIKTKLINDLENQIVNYQLLSKKDSTLLLFKDQEVDLLNKRIVLYDERLKMVDKWYNKPWVGFVGGIASTVLMIHVIDYSLPQ